MSALLASVVRALDGYLHDQITTEGRRDAAKDAVRAVCDHIAPEHPEVAARLRREAGL